MAAGRRDLEGPLRVELTAHVGQVEVGRARSRLRRSRGLDGLRSPAAVDHVPEPGERGHSDDLEALHERRLGTVLDGDDETPPARFPRPERRRQHATHRSQLAAERELPAHRASLQGLRRHLTAGEEHPDGDREVEARPLLAEAGGRQVDRQPHHRELELGVQERRAHALARLANGAVRKPDEREGGQPAARVHLHDHLAAADPLQGECGDAGQHAGDATERRQTRGDASVNWQHQFAVKKSQRLYTGDPTGAPARRSVAANERRPATQARRTRRVARGTTFGGEGL